MNEGEAAPTIGAASFARAAETAHARGCSLSRPLARRFNRLGIMRLAQPAALRSRLGLFRALLCLPNFFA